MRVINAASLTPTLAQKIENSLVKVDMRTIELIRCAAKHETNPYASDALDIILQNASLAAEQNCPACQDTGMAVLFVDLGSEVFVEGDLGSALNEAVRLAYGRFRKSVLSPLSRINTGDNTPAVIHYSIVSGDRLTIGFLAKGAGAENMSAIKMLTPADGTDGIIAFAAETVQKAGGKPCPPLVVGVGVGGTMEKAALLSKRALLRPAGTPSVDPMPAQLERQILSAINATGVGAQGLGGNSTALAVAVEVFPTHIGMLPVAVNLQCHSVRHFVIEF